MTEKLGIPVESYRPILAYLSLDVAVEALKISAKSHICASEMLDASKTIEEFADYSEKRKSKLLNEYFAHANVFSDEAEDRYRTANIQELINSELTAELRLLFFVRNFYESWD